MSEFKRTLLVDCGSIIVSNSKLNECGCDRYTLNRIQHHMSEMSDHDALSFIIEMNESWVTHATSLTESKLGKPQLSESAKRFISTLRENIQRVDDVLTEWGRSPINKLGKII